MRQWLIRIMVMCFACADGASVLMAAENTGLPLPRFVTLASGRVYFRVGPGKMYPVAWEVKREGMPVEIILEYDNWRKIRDFEGTEGWVHKNMLSGARGVLFLKGKHPLFKAPGKQDKVVAFVEEGVVAKLKQFTKEWCLVKVGKHQGWVNRAGVWGLYPHEESSPSKCWIPFLCR